MTVAEVAAILKLNQQTVRNWIARVSSPAVRVGRRELVSASYSATNAESPAEATNAGIWDGEIPLHRLPYALLEWRCARRRTSHRKVTRIFHPATPLGDLGPRLFLRLGTRATRLQHM
jgi:excisionase family DNA binding protein